jgi:hypothetical protein
VRLGAEDLDPVLSDVVDGALAGHGVVRDRRRDVISPYTVGLHITRNTLSNNDVGVFLFNADETAIAPTSRTGNFIKFNIITNDAITNTSGQTPTCGYQAGISDVGTKDLILNNSISGAGYTPVSSDCGGAPAAFVRFVDADSSARVINSNK